MYFQFNKQKQVYKIKFFPHPQFHILNSVSARSNLNRFEKSSSFQLFHICKVKFKSVQVYLRQIHESLRMSIKYIFRLFISKIESEIVVKILKFLDLLASVSTQTNIDFWTNEEVWHFNFLKQKFQFVRRIQRVSTTEAHEIVYWIICVTFKKWFISIFNHKTFLKLLDHFLTCINSNPFKNLSFSNGKKFRFHLTTDFNFLKFKKGNSDKC